MVAYGFSQPWLSKTDDPALGSTALEFAHLRDYLKGVDNGTIPLFNPNFINLQINGTAFSLPVSVANGGTGATTLTGYVKGNGTSAFTAQAVPIPIADGGTNSTTTLGNGLLMVSAGGKIVEIGGNVSAGSNKITSLAAASANGDALRYEQLFGGDVTLVGNLIFNPTTKGITGTTTNNDAPTGTVGEYVSASATAVTSANNNVFADLCQITLTAGDWDINYNTEVVFSTTTWTQVFTGVSTTSGNSSAGLTTGDNRSLMDQASASNSREFTLCAPGIRASLSGSTTYYLKQRTLFSAGTAPTYYGRLSARRVR